MYSAQITGVALEPDYIVEENMRKHYTEEFAKEVAALTQNWYPGDILSDEEIVSFAETFVAWRVRAMESLETTPPNVTDLVCAAPNQKGLRLSMILYRLRRRGHPCGDHKAPAAARPWETLVADPRNGELLPQGVSRGAVCLAPLLLILSQGPGPTPVET